MGKYGKRSRRILSLLSVLAVLAGWAASGMEGRAATADELEQSIREKEEAISQAQEQKEQIQANISNIQAMVDDLEDTKDDLQAYVVQLDGNLAQVQSRINELKSLIGEKQEEIEQTQAELEEAQAQEEAQYEALKVRIRYSYEKGEESLLEMLFSADSFGELLNRVGYIRQMNTYDQEQLAIYVKNRELVAACKEALEEEEQVLEEAKAEVEEEEAGLETLIAEKEAQITSFQSDINNKEAAIAEYEADAAEQDAAIAALEAAAAEAKKQLEELNKPQVSYDGGMFQMPLASYKRVSSEYGYRIHPTLGVNKFHNGVDFAANSGTPIMAAYDGTVVGAAYNSSMGNYVMIDHGDGLFTIYMHASELYVSSGQSVSKGETIAAVGSTGRSTGPHLHFSVRLNGEYVNPWNYLR